MAKKLVYEAPQIKVFNFYPEEPLLLSSLQTHDMQSGAEQLSVDEEHSIWGDNRPLMRGPWDRK